jgi:hypothetical protein
VYKTAVKKFKAAYKNLLNQNKHNEAKTLKSVFYKNERPKLIKQRKENITNAKMK